MRGNVDTRLRKLASEGLDAVLLACAGLERLGLAERIDERIDPEWLLPAPGQGTLALEVRAGDALGARLGALDHEPTRLATLAERAFVAACGGDCFTPLAAFAEVRGGRVRVRGLVASPEGVRIARGSCEAEAARAADAGRLAAQQALADGGDAILAALRGSRP
jgi:hydroxymethylbilane synthase